VKYEGAGCEASMARLNARPVAEAAIRALSAEAISSGGASRINQKLTAAEIMRELAAAYIKSSPGVLRDCWKRSTRPASTL